VSKRKLESVREEWVTMGVSGSLLERVMDVVDIEDAGDLLDPLI